MKKISVVFILFLSAMLITGCTPGEDAKAGANSVKYTISNFVATYFENNTSIASEIVDRPSINYDASDFHNILSEDFHAKWNGTIEVLTDENQTIDINFDVSVSDVILFIDGIEVDSWSDSSKSITYEFTKGLHDIEIEYFNKWHTVGFNTSFTDHIEYTIAEANAQILPMLLSGPKLLYIGAYESADLYNDITVTLSESTSPVILFLSSYHAVNWDIINPHNVDIEGIVYSAYAPRPTFSSDELIPFIELQDLSYGYVDFTNPLADIFLLTGQLPDLYLGEYAMDMIEVPIP